VPIVVDALNTRAQLQFFSPSTFCPIFFLLDISRHVLGTFHARFGHETSVKALCNMLQDIWQMLPVVLITCKVRGAKHDKVEREGKMANCWGRGGKGNCSSTLVLPALTSMGICNTRSVCNRVLEYSFHLQRRRYCLTVRCLC
jgi:hypothetical protein